MQQIISALKGKNNLAAASAVLFVVLMVLMYNALSTIKSVIYYERATTMVYGVVVLVLLGGISLLWTGRKRAMPTVSTLLAVVYALYLGFHAFWAEQGAGYTSLTLLSSLALLIIMMPLLRNNRKMSWGVVGSFMLLLCVVVSHGCLQLFGLSLSATNLASVSGYYSNPAPYAAVLLALLPLAIHFAIVFLRDEQDRSWLWQCLGGGMMLISLAGVLLVLKLESRTALLSLILSTAFILSCHFWKNLQVVWSHPFVKALRVPLLVGLPLCLLVGLFLMRPGSAIGRMLIWKITFLEMVKDAPIFGSGLDAFRQYFANYQAAYFAKASTVNNEMLNVAYTPFAFNEYLKIWVEQGLVGLLLFALLIGRVLKTGFQQVFVKQDLRLTGAVGAVISILIFGVFSYPFNDPLPLLIFFTLCAVILANSNEKKERIIPAFSLQTRVVATVALLLITVGVSQKNHQLYTAHDSWRNIHQITMGEERRLTLASLQNALHNEGWLLVDMAETLYDNQQIEEAITILLKAKEHTADPNILLKLAKYARENQQHDLAVEAYQQVVYMLPYKFHPRQQLMDTYVQVGDWEKARNTANEILSLPVKVPSVAVDKIKASARKVLG